MIYKSKREVNLRVTRGVGILPEGIRCGRIYNAKREVQVIYKAKRAVNLRVTGGIAILLEGTPCGRSYNTKHEIQFIK